MIDTTSIVGVPLCRMRTIWYSQFSQIINHYFIEIINKNSRSPPRLHLPLTWNNGFEGINCFFLNIEQPSWGLAWVR